MELEILNLKNELSKKKEKEDLVSSSIIEKIKNESYSYKCERDHLKVQIQDLKILKDRSYKEAERAHLKYEKAKEKIHSLDREKSRIESEKLELENRYTNEIKELKHKLENITGINDLLKIELIKIKEVNNNTLKINDELKGKLESLEVELNEYKKYKRHNDEHQT